MDAGKYYTYKCPSCGSRQTTSGKCRQCGKGRVISADTADKPKKGVRYKCSNCGRSYAYDHGTCPRCGKNKLTICYRNTGKEKAIICVCIFVILISAVSIFWEPVIAYVNNVFNINIDVNSLIGVDTQIIDKAVPVLPTKSKYVELAQKTVDENPASYDKILQAMIEAGISEEDAKYGLDHCRVDWGQQAARAVEWCRAQGNYTDEFIKVFLVETELFTSDQAEKGIAIYNEQNKPDKE